MQIISAEQIADLITIPDLVDAIERALLVNHVAPPRLVAAVPGGTGARQFLGMPAFDVAVGGGVVKLTMLYPDNAVRGLPVNQAAIVVFSETGAPVAILDGTIVTHMRTGAASALASRHLSRPDSRSLLVIGTGALAPYMALAHCAVRPIERVIVWGRAREKAERTVARIRERLDRPVELDVCDALPLAAREADIISCATGSVEPVLRGKWLRPGTFVDLVGSFSPLAREVDDDAVLKSRLFVDTFAGAMEEAGDILHPMARGILAEGDVEGELADLVSGRVKGRESDEEITLFKSVGTAVEDLAAAKLILARAPSG